jgi:glycosyltransferase involved in cell wall biosynthesis
MKRKIVFVLDNFLIGGSVRLILDILKNFDRNNFELSIVTIYGSGPMEIDFKELEIPIFFIGPKKYPTSFLKKIVWILTIPTILLRLIVVFKKNKPDIVATSLYSSDVLGIFAAWLSGVQKRIIIYHDVHKMSTFREFIRKIFALNLSHKIIAVSSNVKDFLINYWRVSDDKVVVIYNGIDFEKFELGKKPLNSKLTLGFIGRFVKLKDPECFLKSLVILKNKYKLEPEVMMAGGGELEPILKEFITQNNLNKVLFTGWVDEVVKWLKKVDILVVPSKEEGLPLTVLEGLVANKIVVASDIDPMKELISPRDNGVLFRVGDAESLARELNNLLTDPHLARNYFDNISLWINKNRTLFDIKNVSQRYSEILNQDNNL